MMYKDWETDTINPQPELTFVHEKLAVSAICSHKPTTIAI